VNAWTGSLSLGTVPAGESRTIRIRATVKAGTPDDTTLSNTASVSSTTTDPVAGNNSATEETHVDAEADLSITKSDSPDPVIAGNVLTYTLTVDSAGPSDALNVAVSDVVPAGTTFVSASAGGSYNSSTNTVTWNLATVAASDAADVLTFTVEVDPSRTAGLTNTATVVSDTFDPETASNSASEATGVVTRADLSIVKTDSPDPVIAGNDLTYTLTVDSAGPSDALNVAVSDVLPAGTTFVSATAGGVYNSGTDTVSWSLGTVAASDPAVVLSFTVTVDPSRTADLSNTATVTSDTEDPATADDSDTEPTQVITRADLSIVKTDSPDPVVAGTNLTYTLTVDNTGPSDALNVVVSDVVPAGTTFVSATAGGAYNSGTNTVTWSLGTVAASDPAVVQTFTVAVSPSRLADLSNTATVSSTTTDPVPGDNSDTEATQVISNADLSLMKADSVDPVIAGTNLTYTLTVDSTGPSDALNVMVNDMVPAGTTFVSASAGGSYDSGTNTVTWSLGTVAASDAADVLTFTVKVESSRTTGLTNTATVASDTDDPDGANNSASEATDVITQADVTVTKTDSPDPVVVLEDLTYTVTVTNSGPSDASSVSLTDTLPAQLSGAKYCVGAGCDPTLGTNWTGTRSVGTLTAGSSVVVRIRGTVASRPTSGTISNTASVGAPTPDPDAANNQAMQETTVNKRPVSVTVACSSPVLVNQPSTCTATVSDPGNLGRPSGTVTFSNDAGDSGTFSQASCSLPASGPNECSVIYMPTAAGDGSHGITASYGGDATFLNGSGSTTVAVNKRPTTTSISCSPMAQQVNSTMTCTATVTDVGAVGTKIPPQGTVTFWNSAGDVGAFPSGATCTLNPATTTGATNTCTVTYKATTPTVDGLSASYAGGPNHLPSGTATPLLVVFYDPSGGFVTGGGWIEAAAGSYRLDPTLSGRANFGFVSKYQKGATVPTGQTEFQFQVGNLNFHSEDYQWLVVAGCKAQYKGTGTINGQTGYGFLLTAYDGDCTVKKPDQFRIKIWNISTGAIVFDNNYGGSDDIDAANPQVVAGGSIVVHK
jgi:uncharacterized repeat protein (TIGR01451 family)